MGSEPRSGPCRLEVTVATPKARKQDCVDCDDELTPHEVEAFAVRCTWCHHWKQGKEAQARGESYSSGWQLWER
jgi:hypothetical protein